MPLKTILLGTDTVFGNLFFPSPLLMLFVLWCVMYAYCLILIVTYDVNINLTILSSLCVWHMEKEQCSCYYKILLPYRLYYFNSFLIKLLINWTLDSKRYKKYKQTMLMTNQEFTSCNNSLSKYSRVPIQCKHEDIAMYTVSIIILK